MSRCLPQPLLAQGAEDLKRGEHGAAEAQGVLHAGAGGAGHRVPADEPHLRRAGRGVRGLGVHLLAAGWGDEGITRIRRAFTADPDLIRSVDIGAGPRRVRAGPPATGLCRYALLN